MGFYVTSSLYPNKKEYIEGKLEAPDTVIHLRKFITDYKNSSEWNYNYFPNLF